MMGDIGEIAENLPLMKNRADEGDVVQVHATQGIIDQNAIARLAEDIDSTSIVPLVRDHYLCYCNGP